MGIDVALGALPFEELMMQRSSWFEYPSNTTLLTCSAEVLVVLKAFAGRGQGWVDVDGVIVRQSGKLDWEYIHEQLRPLAELKGVPEILKELEERRREFEQA